MEMAAFFFGYSGLLMCVIEYELRYYLNNGEYLEDFDTDTTDDQTHTTP